MIAMMQTRLVPVLLVILALAGLVGLATIRPSEETTPIAVNTDLDLPLQKPAVPTKLSALHGKVVIVDFWATWCGPCKMSIPEVEKVYEKYKDKGLVVIGISEDEPSNQPYVPETVKQLKMTYPIAFASDMPTDKDIFPHQGIPALFVLDKTGTIREHTEGYPLPFDLDQTVAQLLKE